MYCRCSRMARRGFITHPLEHDVCEESSRDTVGSRIRLAGRMLGIPLYVEGRVVQRQPPTLKAWETVGEPHLLVIGRYRMIVNIDSRKEGSHILIAIDYALPSNRLGHWLGRLFGPMYARWCVGQMTRDLVSQFAASAR